MDFTLISNWHFLTTIKMVGTFYMWKDVDKPLVNIFCYFFLWGASKGLAYHLNQNEVARWNMLLFSKIYLGNVCIIFTSRFHPVVRVRLYVYTRRQYKVQYTVVRYSKTSTYLNQNLSVRLRMLSILLVLVKFVLALLVIN